VVDPLTGSLPPLPLMLWKTPPGLELALGQEGVPFVKVREPHPLAFSAGRFVLFDRLKVPASQVRSFLLKGHQVIDVDQFRERDRVDPFRALIDTEGSPSTWSIEGLSVVERVARYPKAEVARRLLEQVRQAVIQRGGIWARLAAYPFPNKSAFNLRLDLDEPVPEDYARFAEARRPIDDCSTHFVSTGAYGGIRQVLDDLRTVDAQSHGHYHFVYREAEANRRNLERAHALLRDSGFQPEGFAGPHGRWNEGIDGVLEDLGYSYSSDFQLGYDDLPFFPWRGDRFSKVLQIPVHPLCEGVFFEAGGDPRTVLDHFVRVVRSKVNAGEPAFVYGHPERRLGRYPEIVRELAEAVGRESLVWRTTLTEFARWWRWRAGRRWSIVPRGDEFYEVQFDDWESRYPLAMELVRGNHVAVIPLKGPRTPFPLRGLAYERRETRAHLPAPSPYRGPRSFKSAVRSILDWETVTPVEDLSVGSLTARVKRQLRRWNERESGGK
jgi:hypothetical protein